MAEAEGKDERHSHNPLVRYFKLLALVLVMLVGNNRTIMGEHVNTPGLNVLGWAATVIMTLAALAFAVTSLV